MKSVVAYSAVKTPTLEFVGTVGMDQPEKIQELKKALLQFAIQNNIYGKFSVKTTDQVLMIKAKEKNAFAATMAAATVFVEILYRLN